VSNLIYEDHIGNANQNHDKMMIAFLCTYCSRDNKIA